MQTGTTKAGTSRDTTLLAAFLAGACLCFGALVAVLVRSARRVVASPSATSRATSPPVLLGNVVCALFYLRDGPEDATRVG